MVATTDLTATKARLLDLTTGVLEMCRDGARDIEAVCDVLQIVKDDTNFVMRLLGNSPAEIIELPAPPKVFTITLPGDKKASELVKLGKYDWSDDTITDKRFPITPHASLKRTIEFVEFDHDPTSEEVLAEFGRQGLKRPVSEDALQFGIEHPEEQRKRPVVFLHESVQDASGRRSVLVLHGHVGERYLDLRGFGVGWSRLCVFAGVRK